jgi:hypothetical protein
MDSIGEKANKVITECGHTFHCSCLMQNAVHNGFGCPYCRTTMAEEPEFSDEDEDEDEDFEDEDEDEDDSNPPIDLIIEKIKEQQIPYDTLVKAYCFDEFFTISQEEEITCRDAYNEIFNNISDIIYKYRTDVAENAVKEIMIDPPDIAESKMSVKSYEKYAECY